MRALSRSAAALALACGCAGEPLAAELPFFDDVAARAGLAFDRSAAEGYRTLADRLGGGVCVIDADGRPPLDLLFALRAGGSRLFVAREPFDYEDQTEARGLAESGDALGCLVLDADGDGDDDVFLTGVGELRFFVREGDRFADASDRLGVHVPDSHVLASATAADYDGDGDLDVAVAGFVDLASLGSGECGGVACGLDLSRAAGAPSYLLWRTRDGYEDATAELAPDLALPEPTLVVGSPDVDGDGVPELYVGNDFGARFVDRVLALGEGGVLRDRSDRLGLAHDAGGNGVDTMGWTSGDVDGDGRFDYATTAFAGFHSPVFLCADGWCEDRGRAIGTRSVEATFRWGNALADLDLDGDVDLVEAAGHLYTAEEGRAAGVSLEHAQPPNLLLNDGRGGLVRVAPAPSDALARRWPARGIAVVDLDDDGRLDVVLGTTQGPPAVLRNVAATDGSFLRVRLIGRAPNTGAVGALVRVHAAGGTQQRRRLAGEGFLGSFDPRLSFGLPAGGRADVEVIWPSGERTEVQGVEVDREISVREPE